MAKYKTLSEARASGLFHPNCRHSVSIFIEGISKAPKKRTPAEIEKERNQYKASQQLNYINRQIQKWKNRKAAAFEEKDIILSNAKLKEWYTTRRNFLAANPEL